MSEEDRRAAEALAVAHEERLARDDRDGRRSRGAFYTPPALVEWVLDRALGPGVRTVLDPACGTGHFLVAAARRLRDVRAVHGSDTDAEAVRIARLRLQAEDPAVPEADIAARVRVADGLSSWEGERFDAVVGNPPFLGQLRRRTAGEAGGLGAYTDTSAVFLHRALDLVRDGGVVAMVQPLSVLGTRDTAQVRAAVLDRGAVTGFWSSEQPVFPGTPVRTCVPVVTVGVPQATVATWSGPDFQQAADGELPDGEWGGLAAASYGIPARALPTSGARVADIATCAADFRDQYYGLTGHVREHDERGPQETARLVTTGLIEPAECRWGRVPTRFAKQRYDRPVVDLISLRRAGDLAAWADARLVPKLLVAGQGRVIEAVVDEQGEWLPSVPVVTVVPRDPADLWRLLAITLAPPVVASCAARFLGTGLSPGSVKVSARQLASLPLPPDREAWDEGARRARATQHADGAQRDELLAEAAGAMSAAYGTCDERVVAWWRERAGISG